jgi:hypothetical protein
MNSLNLLKASLLLTSNMTPLSRYNEAHRLWFQTAYPAAWKDGFYSKPLYPKVQTANGMQTFIINYLTWLGFRATRINVSGRLITEPQKQASGVILQTRKYMKSTTRKGTADISSTIRGRSFMWEVKAGNDKPSDHQLAEQARERKAGGEYHFIHSVDEFLQILDGVLYG